MNYLNTQKKEEKKEEKRKEEKKEEKKEEEEDKGQVPVGCGGTTDLYTWTQTLEEVQIYIPVDPNLKGKDCNIELHT